MQKLESISKALGHAASRPAIVVALALSLAIVAPTAAAAQAAGVGDLSGENLLLLQVRLGTLTIEDAILTVYEYPEGYLVPLGALMDALDLGISVDPGTGTAEGFILQEDRRFSLDVATYAATVEGEQYRFDEQQVVVLPDDIYVDADLLSTWFPFDLTVDTFAAVLQIEASEPLPPELRIERQQRIERLRSRREERGPTYPRLENPYAFLNGPSVDQSLTLSLEGDASGDWNRTVEYSTYVAGDVLGLNGSLSFSGEVGEPFPDVDWVLGRRDPKPVLLGPLRARRFAFGDVGQPGMDLVSYGHSGHGITVSSFPLHSQSEYGTTRFEGDLPAGWDVELYRNDVLVDFDSSDGTGRYQFEDVPLLYGDNVFRFVFYGPQGQRQEELRFLNVGRSLTAPGESYYRTTLTHNEDGQVRGSARYQFGGEGHWAGNVRVAQLPIDGTPRTFVRAGVAQTVDGSLAYSDVTLTEDESFAIRMGFQTEVGEVNLGFDHTQFSLFDPWVTEEYEASSDPLISETALRLAGRITPSFMRPVPASLELEYGRRQSGAGVAEVSNRLSTNYRGVSLSNFLDWTMEGGAHTVEGTLLAAEFIGPYRIRADVDYDVTPDFSAQNLGISAGRAISEVYTMRAGVSHSLESETSTVSAGLSRRGDTHTLGLSGSYDTDREWTAGVSLSFGLGREPWQESWELTRSGVARSGAVSAQVFLDTNGNGHMDPGEAPLEDIAILVNGRSAEPLTGPDGIAFVHGLSTDRVTDIAIDETSLNNPLRVPAVEGVAVFAHLGAPVMVDFPVVQTSELLGTVYLTVDGEKTGVSGVDLQLLDAEEEVAYEITSLYEGFFDIRGVRPGTYVLRASPQQLSEFGVAPSPGVEIVVPATGDIMDGLELVIEADGAED